MQKYDAVVLGGGPGGYECAIRLAQNGKRRPWWRRRSWAAPA